MTNGPRLNNDSLLGFQPFKDLISQPGFISIIYLIVLLIEMRNWMKDLQIDGRQIETFLIVKDISKWTDGMTEIESVIDRNYVTW